MNSMSQNQKALAIHLLLIGVVMALVFIPAGTFHYWQAWTFLAFYFPPSLALTAYLMVKDPKLLERRMRGGPVAEKERVQKILMSIMSVGFVGLLVVSALDHRFAWSQMSSFAALAGDGLMVIGWLAVFFVFRENSFSSATIEVADDQRVISTGPYARVRHPMYAGGLVMLLGMPIALGSWWGVLVLVAILPALIWRMLDEEKFLSRNLPGYIEYRQAVRYRLVPGVW
jgi:protein-S-isoprenylcysteine O-methyltransferase Ste14